jgi:hypothetical protein
VDQGTGAGAQLVMNLVKILLGVIEEQDELRARLNEALGQGGADAAASAGDQNNFIRVGSVE